MLRAPHRLREKKRIAFVMRKGVSFFSKTMMIKAMQGQTPEFRACVVISTKVSKRAVDRNLLRRRITEWLRVHIALLRPGVDVVITVRPELLGASYAQIESELQYGLTHIKPPLLAQPTTDMP